MDNKLTRQERDEMYKLTDVLHEGFILEQLCDIFMICVKKAYEEFDVDLTDPEQILRPDWLRDALEAIRAIDEQVECIRNQLQYVEDLYGRPTRIAIMRCYDFKLERVETYVKKRKEMEA